jgi:hypothetical protein
MPVGHSPEKTQSMPRRQCRILVPEFPDRAPALGLVAPGRNLLPLRCGDQTKFIPSSLAEHQALERQVPCDKQSEGAHPHRNRPTVHNRFPPEGKAQSMQDGDQEKDQADNKGKCFLAHEIVTSSRERIGEP